MFKISLLHHTPIEVVSKATAMPYQSKQSNKLVERVWSAGHKSIARHGMAVFLIEDVSQSLLRQISRHPLINLTVKSTRYCDMSGADIYVPDKIKNNIELYNEYIEDMSCGLKNYTKWKKYEEDNELEDVAKLFLPLAITTDLVVSGNYQALYEFLQLRNCIRTEEEFRKLSLKLTKILRLLVPEIFKNLGCRGDEYKICPELYNPCEKYPVKGG